MSCPLNQYKDKKLKFHPRQCSHINYRQKKGAGHKVLTNMASHGLLVKINTT